MMDRVDQTMEKTVVIIPAFDEEASLGRLLEELTCEVPDLPVVVISDGSEDRTAAVAERHGATVLDLPCNLGVGGAVQAGFRYAFEQGYRVAVRCDGDGQHPPSEIPTLLDTMRTTNADLVIGSRFLGDGNYTCPWVRQCGIVALARFLSLICRKKVTDPTSGFQAVSRPLMLFFSRNYPSDYPEPEALALMRRQGYDFEEIAVTFRERLAGESTIRGWGTIYYVLKVFLALFVDRARPADPRYARANVVAQT